MIDVRNAAAVLALTLVVSAAATPAWAKQRANNPGYAARAQAMGADAGDGSMTADRARALRDCEDKASSFKQYTWGNFQRYQMWACMTEHGQPE
jgi:hypothetical protein